VKQKSIQLSRLRYEQTPYKKGRVVRVWNRKQKPFFPELLSDIWRVLKWFKNLPGKKEIFIGIIFLIGFIPRFDKVKAAPLPPPVPPPAYIHPIARLQPAVAISVPVPAEAPPVAEPSPVAPPVAVVAPGDAKSYALSIVGSSQFACLEPLWNKESGWNPYAVNSIGAMGIPQALGHGQVFALGDWKAQVDWGVNYISATYGTPCAAWAHSQAYNWY
jgi:hypothetical protein